MKEVKFHIPDFIGNYKVNLAVIDKYIANPEYFIDGLIIETVFGTFPSELWNGGRLFTGRRITNEVDSIIDAYNSRGVALSFTYTNPLITEEHLDDPYSNNVLKKAENGKNQVTVFSEILEKYIRTTYPKYSIVSSTCKRINDIDRLNDELNKDYKYVVLDYDWNNKDIFNQIQHKEKCTMLVDPWCPGNCPHRLEHYYLLGKQQIDNHNTQLSPFHVLNLRQRDHFEKCPHTNTGPNNFYEKTKLSVHISNKTIHTFYIPNGINSFKIEGRRYLMFNILESYMYYLVKPEHRDRIRLEILIQVCR